MRLGTLVLPTFFVTKPDCDEKPALPYYTVSGLVV